MRGLRAKEIAALDADREYERIAFLLSAYEFPWDIERSLEFALFRTYAVPSISGLLARTGEFERRPRKRYDDTELILSEILENGLDSPRGRAALARMNAMHGRFAIANADMLYVLSTFLFEPIRWLERFGWRTLTDHEKQASLNYYRELGRRMGIDGIPEDLDAFEQLNRDYEADHFRYAETNRRIGTATLELLLGFYLPRWLLWAGRPVALALMDPPLLTAMGFAPAPHWLRVLVPGLLRLRARILARLPERRSPRLLTQRQRPTYPEGYRIEELGTFQRTRDPQGRPRQ